MIPEADHAFRGTLFSEALPHGSEAADLHLTPIEARIRGRTQSRAWSTPSLRLERGGAGGRMLFLSVPSSQELFATDDFQLLRHSVLALTDAARSIRKQRRRQRAAWAVAALVAFTAIGTALWGLMASTNPLITALANRMPPPLEKKIGDKLLEAMGPRLSLLPSHEGVTSELRAMAKPLLSTVKAPFPFELHIARQPDVNAFALPGGHVVFFTGLLLKAEAADEVLGVLAHEMAHVTQRHALRQLVRSTGLVIFLQLTLGDLGGIAGTAESLGQRLLLNSYTRELEREADAKAVDFLAQAGMTPEGLIRFFARLDSGSPQNAASRKSKGGEDWATLDRARLSRLEELLSTHPSLESRRSELRGRAPTHATVPPPPVADWNAFRKRIEKSLEETPHAR